MCLCLARTPRLLLLNLSSASLPPIPPILKCHPKCDQICSQQLQSTAQSQRIVFTVIMRWQVRAAAHVHVHLLHLPCPQPPCRRQLQ
jgi:hypothetical protein